jgi:threonine/homoserine/homoserine lactone efflux protein
MLIELLSGISYGFAAAVSPGPLSLFLMSQAIRHGWKKTLPAAFSPLVTDAPAAALILAVLSQAPRLMIQCLRIVGGLFILRLAYEAWKASRNFHRNNTAQFESGRSSFMRAAVINWLNPNLYISWSVVLGPMILSEWHKAPSGGIAVLAGFYTTIVATMIAMVFAFSTAKALSPKAQKALIGLSALLLAALGVYQFYQGAAELLALK